MLSRDLISDEIPSLKTSDTGLKALNWMDEFKISHLPITRKKEFLGLISDAAILDLNEPDKSIDNYKISLLRVFVFDHQHVYEAIKLMSNLNLSLIPVLDQQENYLGVISMSQLLPYFGQMVSVQEPGGIILLELNLNDYSLVQIAQIVEGNDAKILSCYLNPLVDSTKIEVTLKINKTDLSGILQTFYRYNYNVKASFHQSEFTEDLKNRFDSFMNYINI